MGRLVRRKKEDMFFDMFVEGAGYADEAAHCFAAAWEDQQLNQDKLVGVKEVEHKGDLLVHRSLTAIEQAFITPIDRNDLLALLNSIEDVTDTIDELSNHCYMMDMTKGNRYIENFTVLLCEATESMRQLMESFANFKKERKQVDELVRVINNIEERGDANYMQAMRALYQNPPENPVDLIRLQTIYELFENCIDRTEDVADRVGTVIISAS